MTTNPPLAMPPTGTSTRPGLRRTLACLAFGLGCLATRAAAGATVINFDDLTSAAFGTSITAPYANLDWTSGAGWAVLDVVAYPIRPSGYANAATSGRNVGCSCSGSTPLDTMPRSFRTTDGKTFTFNSVNLTAAWRDNLSVEIQGVRAGVVVNDQTVVVSTSGPTLITLNWTGIDTVVFTSSGGTHHGGYSVDLADFAIDDLTLSPTPPTLTLKVNGQHPNPPVVSTTNGQMLLTLDMSPSSYTAPVSWYWALLVNSQFLWVTPTGLSATPTAIIVSPPLALTAVPLLNTTLPPATTLTSFFFLVDAGGAAISFDVVAATRP